MIRAHVVVLVGALTTTAWAAEAQPPPPASFEAIWQADSLIAFDAAMVALPGLDLRALEPLPGSWYTMEPHSLGLVLSPDAKAQGRSAVDSALAALPGEEREQRLEGMSRWVSAYHLYEKLRGRSSEFAGSAIAVIPQTRRCFCRSDSLIATLGGGVGFSLASGEWAGLVRCVVSLLASLPPDEEAKLVAEIDERAQAFAKAEEAR
jgi:hypothetical protein